MAMRDWTFADRRPHAARDGLQANAVLVAAKTSTGFSGCFAASSARASASFF